MADDAEKSELPTPRKITEAREKGNVGRSQDMNSALMLFASTLFLFLCGWPLVAMHIDAAHRILGGFNGIELELGNLRGQSLDILNFVLSATLPFMLFLVVTALFANTFQFGLLFTLKPMMPDFSKINPIKGIQQKFSLRSLMIGVMNILKVTLVGVIAYVVLEGEWETVFRTTGGDMMGSLAVLSEVFFKLAFFMILALFVLAIADFGYQKWQYQQGLMMSKQEMRDEHKNYEGDPKIKQKRRQLQLQMARQRMMRDVKDADVVITNPTHLAIALRYDEKTMLAPVVVAKGADLIALRIREIAKENEVPIVENREIARALYRAVDVGDPIPDKLFKAAAEILAYVYSLKRGRRRAGAAV